MTIFCKLFHYHVVATRLIVLHLAVEWLSNKVFALPFNFLEELLLLEVLDSCHGLADDVPDGQPWREN
jgi:hypothetical protein